MSQFHMLMRSLVLRAPHSLRQAAAVLGAQGLIVLIAVGTPIAGLCLIAYISPILVRAVLGDLNVILAALLWLALSTWSAVFPYRTHVLPLTLRLSARIKSWHEERHMQDAAPVREKLSTVPAVMALREDAGMASSSDARID